MENEVQLGADVKNKFKSSVAAMHFNKAFWLDITSHMTSFNLLNIAYKN